MDHIFAEWDNDDAPAPTGDLLRRESPGGGQQAGGTVSPLEEVIRAAAERYLASFPTAIARRQFVEVARKFLEEDPEIKTLPDRRRTALIAGPIDNDEQQEAIVRELLRAVARVPREFQPLSEAPGSNESEGFAVRARFASLIVKGLDLDTRGGELVEIERDFLRLYADAKATGARYGSTQQRTPGPAGRSGETHPQKRRQDDEKPTHPGHFKSTWLLSDWADRGSRYDGRCTSRLGAPKPCRDIDKVRRNGRRVAFHLRAWERSTRTQP